MRHRQDARLYYSISEASAVAKVKPHVLRYWETQFKMLRPKKNKAGNRMYRKRDLRLIQIIKELLYDKGFTISGARRKLLDERAQLREQLDLPFTEVDRTALLAEIRRDLEEVLLELKGLKLEPSAGFGSARDADAALDLEESAGLEPSGLDPAGEGSADLDAAGFGQDERRNALVGDLDDSDDADFDSDGNNFEDDVAGNVERNGRRVLPDEAS